MHHVRVPMGSWARPRVAVPEGWAALVPSWPGLGMGKHQPCHSARQGACPGEGAEATGGADPGAYKYFTTASASFWGRSRSCSIKQEAPSREGLGEQGSALFLSLCSSPWGACLLGWLSPQPPGWAPGPLAPGLDRGQGMLGSREPSVGASGPRCCPVGGALCSAPQRVGGHQGAG